MFWAAVTKKRKSVRLRENFFSVVNEDQNQELVQSLPTHLNHTRTNISVHFISAGMFYWQLQNNDVKVMAVQLWHIWVTCKPFSNLFRHFSNSEIIKLFPWCWKPPQSDSHAELPVIMTLVSLKSEEYPSITRTVEYANSLQTINLLFYFGSNFEASLGSLSWFSSRRFNISPTALSPFWEKALKTNYSFPAHDQRADSRRYWVGWMVGIKTTAKRVYICIKNTFLNEWLLHVWCNLFG